MGLKILAIAAVLGLIATSGHAFAREHQTHDGLTATSIVIALRKAKSIKLKQQRAFRQTGAMEK